MLITCGIAFLGAWIGKKLKLPSGNMIGAILLVSAANLIFGVSPVPMELKAGTQIIAGAFIGAGLDQESLRKLRLLVRPSVIIVVVLVSINLVLGLALYALSPLDLCTAMFATVPGGLAEMSVISEEMGANTPIVSVFQIARLVLTVCFFPIFITHIMKADKNTSEKQSETSSSRSKSLTRAEWIEFLITLLIAGFCGALGKISGIPGGTLLFSAVSAGILKIRFRIGLIPGWAKRVARIIVGAYVGAMITPDVVASVIDIWPYIVFVIVSYLIVCLLTGSLLSRVTVLDKVTAAFSSAPAGASDMALIASEYDVDTSAIAVLQMIRLIMVIVICPNMIALLIKLQPLFNF